MNILSKTIVLIGILLAIGLSSFGIYMQDLLIFSVGLLVALFSIVFALETQHILNNRPLAKVVIASSSGLPVQRLS